MPPLLQMKNVTKWFPGVKALDGVNIEVHRSEILALLGENGAGKSTLMKILAGVYQPDQGEVILEGEHVVIEGPKHSQHLGISIIYQEFNLIPYLSIAENIFLGREPIKVRGVIDWKELHRQTGQLLERVGLESISSRTWVSELSVAEQQLVEIAKALSYASKIIIMDEPTAALNDEDTRKLLKIMRELRDDGMGIIFITHRLEEVEQAADRITVIRDGKYIGTAKARGLSKDEIIKMMVGRDIMELFPERTKVREEIVLQVKALTVEGVLHDISFQVRKGEVLGVAGLMGSGKTELSRALFGLYKEMKGLVEMNAKSIKSPREAIDAGVALVTDDRKQEGLILNLSVAANLLLPALRRISKYGILFKSRQLPILDKWVRHLKIKVHHTDVEVKNLSGGNQQKVVLGKWLQMNPQLLIMNEPTRGIDVGAKTEIYQMIKNLTEQGISILLISSEMPELLGLSHRIMVMHEGRIAGVMAIQDATQEKVFIYASGGQIHE